MEVALVPVMETGPASPNHHFIRGIIRPRLCGNHPCTTLLRSGDGSNNHGGGNHVAAHRVNNNRGRRCHVVSFGHAGSGVPTAMRHVRCSPGHATRVTLLGCTSNRHHCVVTTGGRTINSAIVSNRASPVHPNGYLPLGGVPLNAIVRGVRLGVNGNTRVTHSTNTDIRLLNHSNVCTVLHVHSNRAHHIRIGYHTIVNRMSGARGGLGSLNGTNTSH